MLRQNFLAILTAFVFWGNAHAEPIDRLIVVVERAEWGAEAKKIACHKTDFLIWESGVPQWFEEFADQDIQVLVLFHPHGAHHEQEMWRERLRIQGCRLLSLKIDRSTGSVPASQIHANIHAVLLEVFPEGKTIWDENFRRLKRTQFAPPNLQALSSVVTFDTTAFGISAVCRQ